MAAAQRLILELADSIESAIQCPPFESPFPRWQRSIRVIEALDPNLPRQRDYRNVRLWLMIPSKLEPAHQWVVDELRQIAQAV